MTTVTEQRIHCPSCGRETDPEALTCSLCGEVLRRADPIRGSVPVVEDDRILGMPRSVFYLLLGVPLAVLFTWGPVMRYAGWFLKSLVHEMGHTAAAWFLGCPAFPAIRLDGHAAAMHSEQVLLLTAAVWAGLAYGVFHFRTRRSLLIIFLAAAAHYPLLAYTGFREVAHLAAGHLGELVFATIFFWRALSGGFVNSEVERPVYAMLGWFWMGGNLFLFGSLVLSEASRQWYYLNGSFGMRNDFIRLAEDFFHVPLAMVCLPMILISLLPLPAALLIKRFRF
jgi:hypothetical protein